MASVECLLAVRRLLAERQARDEPESRLEFVGRKRRRSEVPIERRVQARERPADEVES
jgi:hypothetical protein